MIKTHIQNKYGKRGQEWLQSLPILITNIKRSFNLSGLIPLSGLSYNYVISGFQNKIPIILKLSLDIDGLKQEAFVLRHFAKSGAISIIAESEGMLILSRCTPGISLKNLPNQNALKIAVKTMKKLHSAAIPKKHRLPHIRDWLQILDNNWVLPSYYLKKARGLRDKLLESSAQDIILHGDLHRGNILLNRHSWMVIDPKGVIGPSIFETWAFIKNITEDTKFIARFFDFDLQEVRQWYFLRLILAICWRLEDKLDTSLFFNLVEEADQITS